jgi:predicted transposase/invertase (TIGR01784 family)
MADSRNFELAAGKVPYPLKNDLLFHCVVQEQPEILKGLLSAVLQIDVDEIHDVEVLNPISYGRNVNDKQIVLDLLLVLSNAGHINVEIQVRSHEHWTDRSLHYMARRYAEQKADRYYTNLLPSSRLLLRILRHSPNTGVPCGLPDAEQEASLFVFG